MNSKAERTPCTYGKTDGRRTKLPAEHLLLLDVVKLFYDGKHSVRYVYGTEVPQKRQCKAKCLRRKEAAYLIAKQSVFG